MRLYSNLKKSNLDHTRDITPESVASGEAHLSDLAPGQHSFEETSQRLRAMGDTVCDLTDLGIKPRPTAPIAMCVTTELTARHILT